MVYIPFGVLLTLSLIAIRGWRTLLFHSKMRLPHLSRFSTGGNSEPRQINQERTDKFEVPTLRKPRRVGQPWYGRAEIEGRWPSAAKSGSSLLVLVGTPGSRAPPGGAGDGSCFEFARLCAVPTGLGSILLGLLTQDFRPF